MLRLEGVSAGYGQARVLHGLDLTVRSGEVVAILGTNGAGKSTLAQTVASSVAATTGRIGFGGMDVTA